MASGTTTGTTPDLVGALRFARFAYPPNELGYCGPGDHGALLEYGASGQADAGLVELARGFEGAWPYLELIAAANHLPDPLDRRVVDAYWIGNELLERVPTFELGNSLETRFRPRAGAAWSHLADVVGPGVRLSHAFHVFAVYPWVGLLRAGRAEGHALHVLDRCRIRAGEVVRVDGDRATVRSRPLTWETGRIAPGPQLDEEVTVARDGAGFVDHLRPGDVVALHWDWVCERLDRRRRRELRRSTELALALANDNRIFS